jgi:GNAT superfamily N-acetyltransferase
MELVIRPIQESDTEVMVSLLNQLGYLATHIEMTNRIKGVIDREDHCAFLALKDGHVAGWIHANLIISLESEPFVEIKGLVVDEQHRNAGIGKQLIEHVRLWTAQRSISRIRVRCNTKRNASHLFYKKIGFSETKEQKVFDIVVS